MKDIEAASRTYETLVGLKAKKDPKAWARKILDKNAKGERVYRISVEMAMEALYPNGMPDEL